MKEKRIQPIEIAQDELVYWEIQINLLADYLKRDGSRKELEDQLYRDRFVGEVEKIGKLIRNPF